MPKWLSHAGAFADNLLEHEDGDPSLRLRVHRHALGALAGISDQVNPKQAIDRAIINPLFLVTFFGALILTGLAAVLHLGNDVRSAFPWIVVAFVLYLVVIIATVVINVPLNDGIKAAGDPDDIDVTETRRVFDEARWVRSNLVRTVLTLASFACLLWALVLSGAATT